MRTKLAILTSVLFAIGIVAYVSGPLIGQCDSGIKKEHLDPDAGAFVDGTTIEIDDTYGLRIKDGAVNEDKVDKFLPYYVVPRWTRKYNTTNNLTQPSQFTATEFECSQVSMGGIYLSNAWTAMVGSTLFEMKVYAPSATNVTQYLKSHDDNLYAYIDGVLEWQSLGAGVKSTWKTWSIPQGSHTLQLVLNNSGGGLCQIDLFGEIIDNSNVYFVAP